LTLPPQEITGVLLAAGSSKRFGRNKLLEELPDGTPLAVQSALNLIEVLPEVVVVVRPDDLELKSHLQGLSLRICDNPLHENGLGTSIAQGVKACSNAPAWLLALADMPFISPAIIQRVALALTHPNAISAPYYKDRRGHPVGFGADYGKTLCALSGTKGAQSIFKRYANPSNTHKIAVSDPGIVYDIDSVKDLEKVYKRNFPLVNDTDY
jgi:molybdenum cofactor cytidylyltransferase